jgi:hypothetical protein
VWSAASAARGRERWGQRVRSGWSVRSPRRSRRARGRRRRRSSAVACRGRPSAASAGKPLLAAPGALDDGGVPAALAAGELIADLRPPAGAPGGLDQQATHVRVADLRDRALAALLTRGVLRGHQANEGHELLGGVEAAEVADLGHQGERGQSVDAAQAAQPGHQLAASSPARPPRRSRARAPRSGGRRDRARAGRCRSFAAGRRTRCPARRATCAAPHPRTSRAALARAAGRTSTAAGGRASDPAARPRAHAPDRAPLQLARWHVDRLQQTTGVKAGELARITPIGLDPIARSLRHQPRRHHRALDTPLQEIAIETDTSVCGSTGDTPATHDRCVGADHSPTTTGRRAPAGYGSILPSRFGDGRPAARRREPSYRRMSRKASTAR